MSRRLPLYGPQHQGKEEEESSQENRSVAYHFSAGCGREAQCLHAEIKERDENEAKGELARERSRKKGKGGGKVTREGQSSSPCGTPTIPPMGLAHADKIF